MDSDKISEIDVDKLINSLALDTMANQSMITSIGQASDSITIDTSSITTGSVYTVGAMSSPNVWAAQAPTAAVIEASGKLSLHGKEADVEINVVSLNETLSAIQNRLNILRPNTELEAEWDQLHTLGEQYRKLEAEFKEKSKMWSTLKSMPKVDIK